MMKATHRFAVAAPIAAVILPRFSTLPAPKQTTHRLSCDGCLDVAVDEHPLASPNPPRRPETRESCRSGTSACLTLLSLPLLL
jgi:hypothetical protein